MEGCMGRHAGGPVKAWAIIKYRINETLYQRKKENCCGYDSCDKKNLYVDITKKWELLWAEEREEEM